MFDTTNQTIIPVAEAERHRLWVQTDVDGVARCDNEYHLGSAGKGRQSTVPFICTHGVVHRHNTTARTLYDQKLAAHVPEPTVGHAPPSGT
jgi:hypothetical protein